MQESARYQALRENLIRRRREVEKDTSGEIIDNNEIEIPIANVDYLDQIRRALNALDAGTYGFCKDPRCETPRREIDLGRLQALPFVATCKWCEDKAFWARARQQARKRQLEHRDEALLRLMRQ